MQVGWLFPGLQSWDHSRLCSFLQTAGCIINTKSAAWPDEVGEQELEHESESLFSTLILCQGVPSTSSNLERHFGHRIGQRSDN